MDKVLGTFYKGNANSFGLCAWNSVKDDFNEVSKSQNIKLPQNINDTSLNIYNPQNINNQRYNHLSPNLIRMQYFNDNLKEIEDRRNLYLQDYLKNAKYNVYYDQYDPLIGRRRNVQRKLENIKNKLINDEQKKLNIKQKKIEEENRIIDELILENEKKTDDIFKQLDKNNNLNDEFDFENEESKTDLLSNDYSNKNSVLVLSRTSSKENSSNNDDFNYMLMNAKEDNISANRTLLSTKTNKLTKMKSTTRKNSILQKKKPHTDILKVMMNIEKYTSPIYNVDNELLEQRKETGLIFNQMFLDIKGLKNDFKQKMSKYNEKFENNMNNFKEILMMSDNNNIRRSVDNILFRNGEKKLKNDKNYLDSEINIYKKEIDKNIDIALDNYGKQKLTEDYNLKLINEPKYMENDYNLRIKENERSKYGLINIRNLYNKIEKMPDVKIEPDIIKDFSSNNTIKSDLFTFSNNSKNNIFPALRGLNEKNTTMANSEKQFHEKEKTNHENENKKIKKKRKYKNVVVKDLGFVGEDYQGHRDSKKERKETIFEVHSENGINSGEGLTNNNSEMKNSKSDNRENKIIKSENIKKSSNNKFENKNESKSSKSQNKNNKGENNNCNKNKNKSEIKDKKSKKSQKFKENINAIKEEDEDIEENKKEKEEEESNKNNEK